MPELYIPLAIVGVLFIWAAVLYNLLVNLRNHCIESWSNIETELKRRYNLIPNLVNTVRGYAKHEQEVMQAVIEARSKAQSDHGSHGDQAEDENMLVGSLRQLFAVAEQYPELKADRQFAALQEELTIAEDRIQAARRFYNGNVRDLNQRIDVIPSNLIAKMFGFTKEDFYEIEDVRMRANPNFAI